MDTSPETARIPERMAIQPSEVGLTGHDHYTPDFEHGLIQPMVTYPLRLADTNPQKENGLCLPVRNQCSGANELGTVTWLNLFGDERNIS